MSAAAAVSVVMPASDGSHLDDCVESVLGQTFEDFEFVVVADGLEEESAARLRAWARKDERLRVYQRAERKGEVVASNEAVAHARAPLVARMDADDLAHPERLRRQVQVFRDRPDAVMVGTLFVGIDATGRQVRPLDRSRLRRFGPFSPFPHTSAMFRRDVFERVGGYRLASTGWPDLDLYLRIAEHGRVYVVPDSLVSYRYHQSALTLRRSRAEAERNMFRQARCLSAYVAGQCYDDVLEAPVPAEIPSHVSTEVSVRRAAHALWSGLRPERCPLWRPPTLRALLYGTWGRVSPSTLRMALRAWIRLHDHLARGPVGAEPYEWRFRSSS